MSSKYTNLQNNDSFAEADAPPKPPRAASGSDDFEFETTREPVFRERSGSFTLPELNMPAFLQVKPGSLGHKLTLIICLGIGLIIGIITMGMLGVLLGELLAHKPYPDLCLKTGCLRKASQMRALINGSVKPCDDFYQYACGSYANLYPDTITQTDFVTFLNTENDNKLLNALEEEIPADLPKESSERMMRVFFKSCRDEFTNTKQGGKDLAAQINDHGGWYATYSENIEGIWNVSLPYWTNYLGKIMHDFNAMPFLSLSVRRLNDRNTITIGNPSLSLGSLAHYETTDYETDFIRNEFKIYLRSYLAYLWQDTFVPPMSEDILNQTIQDIFNVEEKLHQIMVGAHLNPYFEGMPIALKDLEHELKPTLDLQQLLEDVFGLPAGVLNGTSQIWVYDPFYLALLQGVLTELEPSQFTGRHSQIVAGRDWSPKKLVQLLLQSVNGARRPVELNNYVMFKLADTVAETLGWRYVHIKRVFHEAKHEYTEGLFDTNYEWCLNKVKKYMGYALSAFFIKENFNTEQLTMANDTKNFLQQEMIKRVDAYKWMDPKDRGKAQDKLNKLAIQVGAPAWLSKTDEVDLYYKNLLGSGIYSSESFFRKYQNVIAFYRKQENTLLTSSDVHKEHWPEAVYAAEYQYKVDWNEILMSVGLFQPPIYDQKAPYYTNFAGVGRYLGELLVRTIGFEGAFYDANGNQVRNSWWTQDPTNKSYLTDVRQCAAPLYANITYRLDADRYENLTGKVVGDEAPFLDAHTLTVAAIRIAYHASRTYGESHSTGGYMPGFSTDTTDDAFFIAFAQTFCTNRDRYNIFNDFYYYDMPPPDVVLNTALNQVPEFGTQFSCSGQISHNEGCSGF